MKRLLFSAEDFDKFVSGLVVERHGCQVLLSDIGYDKMLEIIEAKREKLYETLDRRHTERT